MKRRAFTLVELIVVVAVICILAALILAGVQSIRRQADATHSASNIRTLAEANIAYLAENGRYCPADDKRNNRRWHGARRSLTGVFDPADGFLAPYLGKSARHAMPGFPGHAQGRQQLRGRHRRIRLQRELHRRHACDEVEHDGTRVSALAANIESPANTVMFTSSAYARLEGLQEYPYCEPPFWDFGAGPSGYRPSPTVHFRFGGKALVAWCDGHVTLEAREQRPEGDNPHGGQAFDKNLGWFGPDENNGFWNSRKQR